VIGLKNSEFEVKKKNRQIESEVTALRNIVSTNDEVVSSAKLQAN
jgi:hypothetical protein